MTQRFTIRVTDGKELERVLTILFSVGFVLNNKKRIKTLDECCKTYFIHKLDGWIGWHWISLGQEDLECKMVINVYTHKPFTSSHTTVEEVIELVKQNNW